MHIECHLTMRICQNHRGLWDIVQRLPTVLESAHIRTFMPTPQSELNKSTVNREI